MLSWGQLPFAPPARRIALRQRTEALPADAQPMLAWGNGRSYGDVCVNSGGTLLETRGLDRFIAFDETTGILRAEAGLLLDELIRVLLPRGWFLPVTPGTRFVTLGGALANDVHGKNHHRAGTFGGHVRCFELLRSDHGRLLCSPEQNADLYAATIGGLGLTGLVIWVELQLQRIACPALDVANLRFHGLEEFFAANREAEEACEHVVAWIDCLAQTPRGILMAGNYLPAANEDFPTIPGKSASIPFTPPLSLINRLSLRVFNTAYFHRPIPVRAEVPLQPFFYPLDNLRHWNRLYGRAGFYQYQCLIPTGNETAALGELLHAIRASGQGSFLAVLKTFGHQPSPGMLSFPQPGANLALDFPNGGDATLRLFDRLDAIVAAAGGRLYPAKDARMPGTLFRQGYPQWQAFAKFVDPRFSSSFWRRVTEN